MIITNSLGSNYSGEDIWLSLKLLFQPWKWQSGKETKLLEHALAVKFRKLHTGGLRNIHAKLFYKGRQVISEALDIFKIGPGDEVIVQAFTCVAVVRPILESGAKPVYVDVAPKSLNPPLSAIKQKITIRTKAIILQHTLGVINPETKKIVDWCKSHKIFIIQDLAHALGSRGLKKVRPCKVGPCEVVVLSFSQDKVIDGVSGGALITAITNETTNHLNNWSNSGWETAHLLLYPAVTKLIRETYNFGIGKVVHFIAKNTGFLHSPIEAGCNPTRLPNAMAVLALKQFYQLEDISNHRQQIALLYDKLLTSKLKIISKENILAGVNLRYPIWVNGRNELEEKLKRYGYFLVDHWYDAPVAPDWVNSEEVNYHTGSCPNAEALSKHIFNLPTHVNISNEKAIQLAKFINQQA